VAREQAEKVAEDAHTQALNDAKLSQKEPHLDPEVPPSRHKPPGLAAPLPRGGQPPAPYTPPAGSPEAALLDGALLTPGKTPRVERELPPQHTAPPLASLGPALLQQDNQQLEAYHEWQQAAADADRAFDAEVGELSPREWYNLKQRALALYIEHLQNQVKEQCAGEKAYTEECHQARENVDQEIGRAMREFALRQQVPVPAPPSPPPPSALSRPYTEEQWAQFHQHQTGDDDCNAFALAMAHNVLYPDDWLTGDEVQERIEYQWGVVPASPRWYWRHWYIPFPFRLPILAPNKLPDRGVPTWQYDNAVHQILPDAKVIHLTGATPDDLKRAVADGKIVIVAVGWDSNSGIVWKFVKSKWDERRDNPNPQQPSTIGHYMVVVGYDDQQVYVLNPGYDPETENNPSFPQKIPWEQFLQDWSRGNFAIEANSLWAIEQETEK